MSVVAFSIILATVLTIVLGAGYELRVQNRQIDVYMRAHDAFVEVKKQVKLRHFIELRMLRKDLRSALRQWAADKTPFETPSSEKLRKEVARVNDLIRERPEILVSVLKATLKHKTMLEDLPLPNKAV